MKKNLIFHFYFQNSELNQYVNYNLNLFNRFIHVFDGQKIVKIVVDDINIDNSHLISLFPNCTTEVVQNNPSSQESEHFIQSIKEINDRNSITFYAHNKSSDSGWDVIFRSVQKWILSMFYFNLHERYLPAIEENLSNDKVFSGVMRIEVPCPPSVNSDWHYSGTFFWFHTGKLMDLPNWDDLEKVRFAVEEYPGKMVGLDKSHVTVCSENYNWNSYIPDIYNKFLTPEIIGEDAFKEFNLMFNEIFV